MENVYLKNVATLSFLAGRCVGCGMCAAVCPHGVFEMGSGKARILDRNRCMECGACVYNCPVKALSVNANVGCAAAIIKSWFTGTEPSCDCKGGECC